MKNILKNLEKQLAGLKRRLSPPHPHGLVWMDRLEKAEHDGRALDERVVEDRYFDADGETVIIADRITADPSDKGKDFPDGSWDRKYLDAFNRHPPPISGIVWTTERRSLE
jgi:hypothetical protein